MGGLDGVATLLHLARGGEIGESGKSPHTVVVDAPHRQLRRYGTVEQLTSSRESAQRPVLLVPPLAVSTDCYDLTPGLSLVEFLLSTGRVPYVLDFGEMTREDRHLGGFADFSPTSFPARSPQPLRTSTPARRPARGSTCSAGAWAAPSRSSPSPRIRVCRCGRSPRSEPHSIMTASRRTPW